MKIINLLVVVLPAILAQRGPGGRGPNLGRIPEKKPKFCYDPIESGSCYALLTRVGYNPETNRCEVFQWGGCGGNKNRFHNPTDCVNTCGNEDTTIEYYGSEDYFTEDVYDDYEEEPEPTQPTYVDKDPKFCEARMQKNPCYMVKMCAIAKGKKFINDCQKTCEKITNASYYPFTYKYRCRRILKQTYDSSYNTKYCLKKKPSVCGVYTP